MWIVFLPLALFAGGRNVLARRCLVVAGLGFVFWAVTSQQMRFLVPIMPLLAIAGGIGIERLAERIERPRRGAVLGGAVALAVAGALAPGMPSKATAAGGSGSTPPRLPPPVFAHVERPPADSVYAFINRELPSDARIVGVNTNRGFFIDRAFIADSFFEASQIAAWLSGAESAHDARERLAARRITHILVESRDWGIEYPRGLTDLLNCDAAVETLFEDGVFTLLRLR